MIQKFTKVLFIIAVLIGNSVEAKSCQTGEEYHNKMFKVTVYLDEIRNKYTDLNEIRELEIEKKPMNTKKLKSIAKDMKILFNKMTMFTKDQSDIAALFKKNRNNYKGACKILDSMVKKYNINLKENAKKTRTVKDMGRRDGMCNPPEAGTLTMLFTMEARTRTNGKFMTSREGKKFMKLSRKMMTHPGELCEEIKRLSPKYGISFKELLKKNKALYKKRPAAAH